MRNYKMRTTEDQMNFALVTLTGLLNLRRKLDWAIENLMNADLALNSKGNPDEKVVVSKECVHRAKTHILEISKLIDECLEGNI